MSGIVGSSHNIRGSGLVAKLGTDGQVFTSAGAGVKQTFEDAAGGGAWNLIKTLTSDGSDSNFSFINGADDVVLDSTYDEYCFRFNNLHSETDSSALHVNFSADGGSNYNLSKINTFFKAEHTEADATGLYYSTGEDTAGVVTASMQLIGSGSNDNDHAHSGYFHLYNPGSTTFIKQFIGLISFVHASDIAQGVYITGYVNTASAINAVQFTFAGGDIEAGKIKLYGIS